ncbi:MAG: hypothetical protein FVQ83_06515 [Chloroflexi bacterium]|nr:hypothetical protein [Chloroflexota bacterium]
MNRLFIVGVILTEWLLITAEITDQWQYYFWAFLVVILWSEAVNNRNPRLYPKRSIRIAYFSIIMFSLLMFNKSILYVQEVGLPVPGS